MIKPEFIKNLKINLPPRTKNEEILFQVLCQLRDQIPGYFKGEYESSFPSQLTIFESKDSFQYWRIRLISNKNDGNQIDGVLIRHFGFSREFKRYNYMYNLEIEMDVIDDMERMALHTAVMADKLHHDPVIGLEPEKSLEWFIQKEEERKKKAEENQKKLFGEDLIIKEFNPRNGFSLIGKWEPLGSMCQCGEGELSMRSNIRNDGTIIYDLSCSSCDDPREAEE